MPPVLSMRMDGWADLARALEALGNDRAIKATMKRALLKRAEPMVAYAQSLAPRRTGKMARRIAVSATLSRRQRRSRPPGSKADLETTVYVGAGASRQAVLMEFGTGPRYHKSGKSTGQVSPRPFMRPAWEATKDAILSGFGKDLGREIEASAKRIARKQARLLAKGRT